MSWSDDIRCLYCDGRLPLYRKITNGQFCSSAHRKAYWQEHERLAVERLHQTHDRLQAYRPAGAVEAILGDADAPDEPVAIVPATPHVNPDWTPPFVAADDPAVAGFVTPAVIAMPKWLADSLVAIDVEPIAAPGMIRRPVIIWSIPDFRLIDARQVLPDFSRVAVGAPQAIASIEAIHPTADPAHPEIHLKSDAAPESGELQALLDREIPELARFLSLPAIAARQLATSALLAVAPEVYPMRAQLPLNLLRMKTGFANAAPVLSGLRSLPVAHVPAVAQSVKDDLRALDLHSNQQAPLPTLGQPVRFLSNQPQLRLAGGRRYDVATKPATNVHSIAGPENFSSVPQISLPERQAKVMVARATAASAAPAEPPKPPANPEFEPNPTGLLPIIYTAHAAPGTIEIHPAPPALSLPQPLGGKPMRPESHLEPLDNKPTSDAIAASNPMAPPVSAKSEKAHVWTVAIDFWNRAPRDLKLLTFALPILLGLALHPALPKVRVSAPAAANGIQTNVQHAFNAQWTNVKQTMLDRAAIALDEDFRSGLDDWWGRNDATAEWSFDATGFVRPTTLALYRPSMGLNDYQLQFLAAIDKQALSWVVRAADYDNFYVIKLEVLKSGPLPTIGVTRYAVVNGKADSRGDTLARIDARSDQLYRVRVDVRGDDFTLTVQGQLVDSWSEPRLKHGGIGFFSARGEESRVRWVQVTHQYDMLGRLCAYLAPYNAPASGGGSFQ